MWDGMHAVPQVRVGDGCDEFDHWIVLGQLDQSELSFPNHEKVKKSSKVEILWTLSKVVSFLLTLSQCEARYSSSTSVEGYRSQKIVCPSVR